MPDTDKTLEELKAEMEADDAVYDAACRATEDAYDAYDAAWRAEMEAADAVYDAACRATEDAYDAACRATEDAYDAFETSRKAISAYFKAKEESND